MNPFLKHIGEKLEAVALPWDGECEEDSMILKFESGSVCIIAHDYSWPSSAGSPALVFEEVDE